MVRLARRLSPEAQVVLTGCYAETAPADIAEITGADIVLRNADKPAIADAAARTPGDLAATRPAAARRPCATRCGRAPSSRSRRAATSSAPSASSPTRAAARSACRSRTWCAQVQAREADGVLEVVLTGTQLGNYGRDLGWPRGAGPAPAARGAAGRNVGPADPPVVAAGAGHQRGPARSVGGPAALPALPPAAAERVGRRAGRRCGGATRRTSTGRRSATDPASRAGRRDHDGRHRRVPGRDGGRLRSDARAVRGDGVRGDALLPVLAAAAHRRGEDGRAPAAGGPARAAGAAAGGGSGSLRRRSGGDTWGRRWPCSGSRRAAARGRD